MDLVTPPSRRTFLECLGTFPAASMLASVGSKEPRADLPALDLADAPRDLKPTGSNIGSLFEQVEKLAESSRYALSFLSDRFRNLDDFKTEARNRIFDLVAYRPDKVDPKPEVVERVEREGCVREKLIFSTGPRFRVPAYVLTPKNLRQPAPAIVDLHSHGGMFLFGKEKVIDLGRNHPVMDGETRNIGKILLDHALPGRDDPTIAVWRYMGQLRDWATRSRPLSFVAARGRLPGGIAVA